MIEKKIVSPLLEISNKDFWHADLQVIKRVLNHC